MPTTKSKEIIAIENLMLKGEYYKAITLLDEILENKKSSKLDTCYANLLKVRTQGYLRAFESRWEQFEEDRRYTENAVQVCCELDDRRIKGKRLSQSKTFV